MTTTAPIGTDHPPDERIAAFVEGRLDEAAMQHVREHIYECDECYAVVQSVSEYVDVTAEEETVEVVNQEIAPVARPRFGRVSAIAAALAVAAAAVVISTPMIKGRYAERQLFEASAGRLKRPIAARLGGEVKYQDHEALRGGEKDDEKDNEAAEAYANLRVEEEAATLTAAANKENPTSAELTRAGIAALMMKERTAAIKHLEDALKAGGDDVKLYTALAAAYIADGKYQQAAKFADKAWAMEKTPVTAWNRALALQTKAAWADYLKLDPNSEWANEVRTEHLPNAN